MIELISVENYKSLKKNHIDCSNLNVFTGMNGMGKSSLIQVLLLLRQTFQKNGLKNDLELKGSLVDVGVTKDVRCDSADTDVITFELTINGEKAQWYFDYSESNPKGALLSISDISSTPIKMLNSSLFNNHFQYLSADRISPEKSYEPSPQYEFVSKVTKNGIIKKENVLRKYLGNSGEFTPHYLSAQGKDFISLKQLEVAYDEKNQPLNLIGQVDAWMGIISPNVRLNISYNPDAESYSLGYQFFNKATNQWTDTFKAINAAFGLTYALPIITALLIAEVGDIVIIENPESHLHPHGQSKLGELIGLAAQAGVQLFIETHSDHIINGVRIAIKKRKLESKNVKIYYFTRNSESHISDIYDIPINDDARLSIKELRKNNVKGFLDQIDIDLETIIAG